MSVLVVEMELVMATWIGGAAFIDDCTSTARKCGADLIRERPRSFSHHSGRACTLLNGQHPKEQIANKSSSSLVLFDTSYSRSALHSPELK